MFQYLVTNCLETNKNYKTEKYNSKKITGQGQQQSEDCKRQNQGT